ncbi:MAG: 7-cyano-7-deazaguanine synthase [Isosphaeraceae bacterium]
MAFSGGVDSTVVAQAAFVALGDKTVAVTAVSESLAEGELEEAQALARQIGIRHRVIRTEDAR